MGKLNQEQLIDHIKTLLNTPLLEVGGETWSFDKEEKTWTLNESLKTHCPECGAETEIRVEDYTASFKGCLIFDPKFNSVHVDYAMGDVNLYNPEYHCSYCDALLQNQSVQEFEEDLKKSLRKHVDEKEAGNESR
jgi:hypothetical protein